MKPSHEATAAEILRRRAAGETYTAIGIALGMKQKAVQSACYRAQERAKRPVKVQVVQEPRQERAAPVAIKQPAYNDAIVRQVHGSAAMQPLTLSLGFRLARERAAVVYSHSLLSCASRVLDGWGG